MDLSSLIYQISSNSWRNILVPVRYCSSVNKTPWFHWWSFLHKKITLEAYYSFFYLDSEESETKDFKIKIEFFLKLTISVIRYKTVPTCGLFTPWKYCLIIKVFFVKESETEVISCFHFLVMNSMSWPQRFRGKMSALERNAWQIFRNLVNGFLDSNKADYFEDLVKIYYWQTANLVAWFHWKYTYLHSRLDLFQLWQMWARSNGCRKLI